LTARIGSVLSRGRTCEGVGGTPPSANYKVSVDITLVGESDSDSGVVVRTDPTAKTGVEARENAIGRYDLIKWVAGAFTLWENNVIASGTRLSVVANGDDFWMELDGVMIGSVHTDSGLPAPGKAAITFFNGMTNTDGRHISNLIAAP
jgi:uncharacterized DUF497 family protein